MAKRIITINRMFGSNGRLIGKTLAENLDIGFYDKELIDMAAKKNNIPFDTLAKVDEKKASQWVFPVDSELQFTDNFSFVPMNDVLYDLQRKIILSLPQKEDCVIVGRCATNILKDKSLKIFIHAPFEERVQNVIRRTGREEAHQLCLPAQALPDHFRLPDGSHRPLRRGAGRPAGHRVHGRCNDYPELRGQL